MKHFLIIMLGLLMISTVSCKKDKEDSKYPYKVTYSVTSSADTVIVAYYSGNGIVSDNVSSGWTKEVTINSAYATITAGDAHSTYKVKAQIIQNGKVVKEDEGMSVSLTY